MYFVKCIKALSVTGKPVTKQRERAVIRQNIIKWNQRLFSYSALEGRILASFLFFICIVSIAGCSAFPLTEQADGTNEFVNREKAAQARLALGLAYLEQDNLKLAYGNLQRAMDYSPGDYRVYIAIALYEQRIGEYDKALENFQKALVLAPNDGAAQSRYGALLCRMGKYSQAHEMFQLALNHTSYDIIADGLENTGYCYLKQGQPNQAQEFLNRALKYEPVKSKNLLVTAEHYLDARQYEQVAVLLDIYQQNSPMTAESLWLQIRFATLKRELGDVERYGRQLAENFSQSEQYKQFLAHENRK